MTTPASIIEEAGKFLPGLVAEITGLYGEAVAAEFKTVMEAAGPELVCRWADPSNNATIRTDRAFRRLQDDVAAIAARHGITEA